MRKLKFSFLAIFVFTLVSCGGGGGTNGSGTITSSPVEVSSEDVNTLAKTLGSRKHWQPVQVLAAATGLLGKDALEGLKKMDQFLTITCNETCIINKKDIQ